MLMAISRGHINFIEEVDYQFGESIINHAAERLEETVIPQSQEVRVGREILRLLPSAQPTIIRTLSSKYGMMWVKRGIGYLVETEQIKLEEGKFTRRTDGSND